MAQTENNEVKIRFTQKTKILTVLKNGKSVTSYAANAVGNTVDSRKIISNLRREGHKIFDFWETGKDGRRFKVYYLDGNQCFVTKEWLSSAMGFEGSMRTSSKFIYFNKKHGIYLEFKKMDESGTTGVSVKTKDLNLIYCQDWKPKFPGDCMTRGEIMKILESIGFFAEDDE